MIPQVALLPLALWTASVSAFYPYDPVWRQAQEKARLNGEAKRDAAVVGNDGVAFQLKHRASQSDESPAERAARQAQWLSSKFKHVGRSQPVAGASISKRANEYKIQAAEESGKSMTAGINQDGTDYSYFVTAQLGSKGKELYMLVDTGAGSSWVMGESCTDKACVMHNSFGPSDSDTFQDAAKSFSVSYGSGTVNGNLVSDTITLAGVSFRYQFGLASKTSEDFAHFAFDGILGLSMGLGASQNFLKTLGDSKKLNKNVFGIHLNRASDGANKGEIIFGSTNSDLYTGDVTYTPVGSKEGDWAIQIDDMSYDGKKAKVGGVLSYIDTGTSFVFGPPDSVKKLHSNIPGASSSDDLTYNVPCDTTKPLVFTFSGVDYEISAKDWIAGKDGDGKCTSNIYGHEVVEGSWLLGDTFLKNVYTVFDKDEKKIGFAKLAGAQSGSASSSSSSSTSGSSSGGSDSSAAPSTTSSGPISGSPTTLSTEVVSQTESGSASHSSRPVLGLSGHETDAASTTETGKAKPTESSDSGAMDATTLQNGKVAMVMFIAALLALTA